MEKPEVVIVDTGVANRHSVRNAIEHIGCNAVLSQDPDVIVASTKLVFPGVGSFAAGMKTIRDRGLIEPLFEAVICRGVPVLGICLGFQMMAESSEEDGHHEGLGWVPGRVRRIKPNAPDMKIPHIGFNSVTHRDDSFLFDGLPQPTDFYFLHSYRMEIGDAYISATCDYGGPFAAAIEYRNIAGTQFHPEKSQGAGLRVLRNFIERRSTPC